VILAATTHDFHEVYNELKEALRCQHSNMQALSNIGILLVNWGMLNEGIAELKKALEIDPHNAPTLERLGYAYMKKGLLGAASICFKKILTQKDKNLRAFLYLAQIYSLSGDHEKARQTLAHFLDIMHDKDLIPFLEDLIKEKSLLQASPDMSVILPLLAKTYQHKETLFRDNMRFLLDTL
jgi:tetratricopeptide (TPR) repeat protein